MKIPHQSMSVWLYLFTAEVSEMKKDSHCLKCLLSLQHTNFVACATKSSVLFYRFYREVSAFTGLSESLVCANALWQQHIKECLKT